MRVSFRFLVWAALWAIALVGMGFGARAAGRAFDAYMESGNAPAASALALLPGAAEGFVFEPDLVARWRLFRRWKLDASLQEFSRLRPFLETWGLAQPKVGPLESLLLRGWSRNLAVAWTSDGSALWFAAPVGTRQETARWLADFFLRSSFHPEKRRIERRGQQWWIEIEDARLLPEGRLAQIAVVRGIAVLAIGRKGASPITAVLSPDGPGIVRCPEAAVALEGALRPEAGLTGLLRVPRPGHPTHTITWRITPAVAEGDSAAFTLDLRIPSCRADSASAVLPDAARLGALAQPEDALSLVTSPSDLAALRVFLARALPRAANARLEQAGRGWIPESYRPIWTPVFDKLDNQLFLGIGNPSPFTAKGRLVLPRVAAAAPFEDPAAFLAALEQTVLRVNREQHVNLIIRKRSGASGDSYRVTGGDFSWARALGLAELPSFGFAKGLLLVATDSPTLEKAMERAATEAAVGEPQRGSRLRASLPRFGGALRTGLLVAGAFLDSDDEWMSPSALRWVDETLAALRSFGEARVDLECEPGAWKLRARLTPARQP